jgi:c-di-GMP-binding flagellar brake protein YcgR
MCGQEKERRQFVRLNVLTDISYAKRLPSEAIKLSLSKNIGAGGICLIVYEPLQKSEVLDLKIYLPEGSKPVSAVGKVVWTKEFSMGDGPKNKRYDAGIEFIEIGKEDLNKIQKYVFSHV